MSAAGTKFDFPVYLRTQFLRVALVNATHNGTTVSVCMDITFYGCAAAGKNRKLDISNHSRTYLK